MRAVHGTSRVRDAIAAAPFICGEAVSEGISLSHNFFSCETIFESNRMVAHQGKIV
jgi:hypothetical protein